MNWLWFLLIGLAAGWLAGLLTRGKGFGAAGNLLVGALGAVLGGFLLDLIGLKSVSRLGSLVSATLGAILLLALVNFIRKKTR
ncbi:MAG: GlsB/YeaQ/YmgE family stress response membrane protein [Phycisphaerales bacterium]|nr:GlsB/YeaQ/YmgE family stress response membrane protein [Phycisphaerales bacterium]